MSTYGGGGRLDWDYEDDAPPTHCPGPSYDDSHGCGRFLSVGAWMCDRCRAETDAYYKDHKAEGLAFDAAALEDLPF